MSTPTPLESRFPLKPLKFIAPARSEKVDSVPSDGVYLGLEQFESWSGRLSGVELPQQPEGGANVFYKGDILFGKLRPYLAKGWVAERSGYCTTECLVLDPIAADARFVRYCLLTPAVISAIDGSAFGSKMPRADWGFIGSINFPVPSKMDQVRISDFLDDKTARIGALIAEKERLVSAVREYEQAELSRILIYGLGAHQIMPTGRPFIAEAPVHWRVTYFKRALLGLGQGWSPQCDSRPAEAHEWGVLKVGCVNGTSFNVNENKALPASLEPDLTCVLQRGDVLVSRANTRELVGMAALVENDHPNILICDKLYRLELRPDWVTAEFTVLLLRSDASRRQIELGASGASSSMQNISQNVIRELSVAIPPVAEQNEIVLKAKTIRESCNLLVQHCEEHISRLREYRSSLISAAVTGQLDINNFKEIE